MAENREETVLFFPPLSAGRILAGKKLGLLRWEEPV
jgi:hypothetical protein